MVEVMYSILNQNIILLKYFLYIAKKRSRTIKTIRKEIKKIVRLEDYKGLDVLKGIEELGRIGIINNIPETSKDLKEDDRKYIVDIKALRILYEWKQENQKINELFEREHIDILELK